MRTCNLCDGAFRCQIAVQNLDVSRGLNGLLQWADNILTRTEGRQVREILAQGLAGTCHTIAMQQTFIE
jgi:hypothetical protein